MLLMLGLALLYAAKFSLTNSPEFRYFITPLNLTSTGSPLSAFVLSTAKVFLEC